MTIPPPRRLFVWDPFELNDFEARCLAELLKRDLPFDAVQIRIRSIGENKASHWRELLTPLCERIRHSGRILWVNRHLELAQSLKAHGLEIGTGDPAPPLPYGYSIHDEQDLDSIPVPPPTFLLYGHIYPTPSKPDLPPRGIEGLKRILRLTSFPVVAIGGITPEHEEELIALGAVGIATIRNFTLWGKDSAVPRFLLVVKHEKIGG